MFKYFPHTTEDINAMLKRIGIDSLTKLYTDVPKEVVLNSDYNLPSAHSELELIASMEEIASANKLLIPFIGAGSYDVYVPSIIGAITSRQEFLTSYTPYQPEVSQGTLQYIFEFQSMICELTGLDVANASMYDGATATAEAMFVAAAASRKNKMLVSQTMNPNTIDVIKTYAKFKDITIEFIEEDNKVIDLDDFKSKLSDDVGGVIVEYPNYFGNIEDYQKIKEMLNDRQLFIMNVDPSVLGVLKSPAYYGADIACGDGQTLGIPLSFGGPYVGFFSTTKKLMRRLPGRICGMTEDVDGKRGFVLTLQAREQHIRREKATSNICSNQSLMALHTVIYMALMGRKGLQEVGQLAYSNAHYLYDELLKTNMFSQVSDAHFFKEFVLKYNGDVEQLNSRLIEAGFLNGLHLGNNELLFCATEKRTKAEIDKFVNTIKEVK